MADPIYAPTAFLTSDPIPSILSWIQYLTGQVSYQLASISNSAGQASTLGTVTASKKFLKPFIIGFIPPSNPVQFIPVIRTRTKIADVPPLPTTQKTTITNSEGGEPPEEPGLMTYGSYDGPVTDPNDPLRDRLFRTVTVDDKRRDIARQQIETLNARIDRIKSTPPLIMLVNPREFNREYAATVDFSPKTRTRNIIHTWLEQPVRISCSGSTAGQYVVDAEGNGGLSNQNRVHSLSYQNLLSLIMIYKNNGVIYAGPDIQFSSGVPLLACSLYIYYDDHLYIGSFDDFSVDDSATNPYNLNYSFKFTVRYDNDVTLTGDIIR